MRCNLLLVGDFISDGMALVRGKCTNDPDQFCYICGEYIYAKHRRNVTDFVKSTYLSYFGIPIRNQDKPWAPHTVCSGCTERLRRWTKQPGSKMEFAVPMIWREPTSHTSDCYFCTVHIGSGSVRKKTTLFTQPMPAFQVQFHTATLFLSLLSPSLTRTQRSQRVTKQQQTTHQ